MARLLALTLYRLITSCPLEVEEVKRPEDTVRVMVAARDLYQGHVLTEEDLYAVQIPFRYLPEGVFLSPEHVVGRLPRERILADEVVRAERLADLQAGEGMNVLLPRGWRGLSVASPGVGATTGQSVDVHGPSGLVEPGVLVLWAGASSVLLVVSAGQAERIAQIERTGGSTLVLRADLAPLCEGPRAELVALCAQARIREPPDRRLEPILERRRIRSLTTPDGRITVEEWIARTRASVDGTFTIIQGRDEDPELPAEQ